RAWSGEGLRSTPRRARVRGRPRQSARHSSGRLLQFALWCSIERETGKMAKQVDSKPLNSTNNATDNRPGANAPEFSVSELSGAIKRALEDGFGFVRLRGEISGYRGPHSSGHCYFALKDDKAKIEAVIWKGAFGRLRFKPEEGMEVVVQGRVTTFQ